MKRNKLNRREDAIAILRHGAEVLPPEYLARNQSEPERIAKVKAAAEGRRQQRNARRAARSTK